MATKNRKTDHLATQLKEAEARVQARQFEYTALYAEHQKLVSQLEGRDRRISDLLQECDRLAHDRAQAFKRYEAAELIALELAKALQRR